MNEGMQGLISVASAAAMLHISQSTLWRWIEQGRVRAYRIGPKRVWLKEAELESLLERASRSTGHAALDEGLAAPPPLTAEQRRRGLAAIEEARRFQAELLAARGGRLFEPAWELLHDSREERSRQLS